MCSGTCGCLCACFCRCVCSRPSLGRCLSICSSFVGVRVLCWRLCCFCFVLVGVCDLVGVCVLVFCLCRCLVLVSFVCAFVWVFESVFLFV